MFLSQTLITSWHLIQFPAAYLGMPFVNGGSKLSVILPFMITEETLLCKFKGELSYASSRAFNLLTRDFNLPARAFNLLTRRFELVTRGFELVTREYEIVTRVFELVTRGF